VSKLTALHSFLKTKKDASKLNGLFEKLNSELFKENFNLSDFLSQNASYELKELLEKIIQEAQPSTRNTNDLRSLFSNLQKEIAELPIVHMIMSFAPNEQTVNMIHSWFYTSYKKIVILEISIDKSLIAGAVISFGGQANDYSLATQIEQIQQ